MFQFQITLFVMMMIGFLCNKISIITKEVHKNLTDLLLYIILPCNIFASFLNSNERDILASSGQIILMSLFIQVFCYAAARIIYRKANESKKAILEYATMTSNFSFIGIPVVEVIYGSEGVILAAVSQIIFRFFIWTVGHNLFLKTSNSGVLKRAILSPCVDSILLGALFLFMGWSLPNFLTKAITDIGSCMTPICMLLIGYLLAEISFKESFEPTVIIFSVIRLIVLPVAVFLIMRLIGTNTVLAGVMVLQTAMPAPTTTTLLAAKYGKDANFAAEVVFSSTLISLITISLWGYILT